MMLQYVLLTVIVLAYGLAERNTSITQCPRVCYCHDKTATCGKHKHGLTSIPAVPAYIKTFILLNANIPTVNRSVLSPISHCALHSLTLQNDGIKILLNDSFTDFQELERLDLSGNIIPVSLLKEGFHSIGNHLQKISLNNMSISNIPMDLFETSKVQNVTNFSMSHNKLSYLNEFAFLTMPSLMKLDVSYNRIESLFYEKLKSNLNIRILNLGYNWLGRVPYFCRSNGSKRYNVLENLNLENNAIRRIHQSSFLCLTHLKTLTLTRNLMRILPNNVFSKLPKLSSLHLNSLFELKQIEELAFNSTISILHLAENARMTLNTFNGKFPFKWASNLNELNLQHTPLILPTDYFRSMLLQLKSIRTLNLQNTRLYAIPPITLCYLPFLTKLDLQANFFSEWNSDMFWNVTQLKTLNLQDNRISLINETSFPVEMRRGIKKLYLGDNDFLCTCALLWFRTWMKEMMKNKTILFVNFPKRYYCKNPMHLRLDKFNPTPESCEILSPYVIAGVATGTFVIVAMAVTLIIYRNRWNIRYCFYSRRRRQYQQLPGRDVQIKYNAFVSSDSSDMDWMMDEVADFLENELGLKLCIHRRDFEGAKMIIDNIMDCMEQSEKIILIISNSFARSNWCQCELKIAINQHFERQQAIVVIIREAVYRKNMTQSLKALFETTTYIQWEEEDNARKVFRRRLADVMGCEYII